MPIEPEALPEVWLAYKEYEYGYLADRDGSWICRVRKDGKEVYRNEGKAPLDHWDEAGATADKDAKDYIDSN